MDEYTIVKNEAETFIVLDYEIELFQSETAYGVQTAAIVHGPITQHDVYFLCDDPVSLETAINLWQDMNNQIMSQEEFDRVVIENALVEEE